MANIKAYANKEHDGVKAAEDADISIYTLENIIGKL